MKKKVFISFDFDNDSFLRNSLVWQSKHNWTPFDMEDWSVKIPWNEDEWKEKCLTKIKRCDLVIVMVWEKTKNCHWVKAEIKMAKEVWIPVVWVQWYSNKNCPRPEWLEWYYNWTWDNINTLINWWR